MIHEVHSGCIRKPHFPSTGQWTKLRYRLLLDGVVGILPTIHTNILLASRINPGRRSGVVIHEIRTAFWSMSLFPQWWEFSSSSRRGPRCHHSGRIRSSSTLLLLLQIRRVGTSPILWQGSVLMPLPLHLGIRVTLNALGVYSTSYRGSIPTC